MPAKKVMKVMKVLAMKSANSSAKDVMKKPAKRVSKEEAEGIVLTESALQKLNGASEDKIQDFINKLSDKDQQVLWKKYERVRKSEGTDDEYRTATNGPGKIAKVQASLRIVVQSGCSTKTTIWKKNVSSFRSETVKEQLSNWQPMQFMLTKYGQKELKARVLAGTMQVRACPADPRFPEFKEVVDSSTERSVKVDDTIQEHAGKGNFEGFQFLADMKNTGQKLTFVEDQDEQDPDKIARSLLGLATKGKDPADNDGGKSTGHKNVAAAAGGQGDGQTSTLGMEAFETASALDDKTDIKVCMLSMLKVKTALNNILVKLDEKALDDTKFANKASTLVKELKKHLVIIEKAKASGPTKLKSGVVKKFLQAAATAMKKADKLLSSGGSKK